MAEYISPVIFKDNESQFSKWKFEFTGSNQILELFFYAYI
jgi:hypothetical protein